ncbi:MAG: DUF402 domain-containing protein [Longimicrobiales bacterium]
MSVFEQWLVHETAQVRVTLLEHAHISRPLMVHGQTILEPDAPIVWFTFPDIGHDIGRFHQVDGRFTGFYCDIVTPVEFGDRLNWQVTDLFLDVWLGLGASFEVLDADELESAVSCGALHAADQRTAWAEVERLRAAWQAGTWPPQLVHEWTLERARAQLA